MNIRKARIQDVTAMLDLIDPYVKRNIILAKTREDIIERIRDFSVCEEDGRITGCAALFPGWENLGEVRTTAVAEDRKGTGIGTGLVNACISEARALGLPKIFALTYEVKFFERLGFTVIEKETLPHKIFKDCIRCRKFLHCDETAVVLVLDPEAMPGEDEEE